MSLPAPARAWLVALALAAPWALAAVPDLARALADPPPRLEHALARRHPGGARRCRRSRWSRPSRSRRCCLTALTDALVYAVPPGNTADTPANQPTERLRDNRRIFDAAEPRDTAAS